MKKTSKTTMTSGKIPLVFFGSGPVSAKSLQMLKTDFEIEAVVTKPTTAKEMKAAVGDVPIYTVDSKKSLDALIDSKPFRCKLAVLIDFGIIVSQKVIDYFPLGIINSHFSLLPDLRGADPITFAILSGQTQTGVSLMLLVEAMDEGPVIACGIYELNGQETTPLLTDRLINLSDALLKTEIPKYIAGETSGVDQSKLPEMVPNYPTKPTYSRKLTKDDGILDFSKSAEQLEREIRAFIEWPKSRTTIAGKDVIITKAHKIDGEYQSGEVKIVNKSIFVGCKTGALAIDNLKPAGKNEMTGEAFLAGYKILF